MGEGLLVWFPLLVTIQRSHQMQVRSSGGGASLALSGVAALVGASAPTRAEAGLLCHASAAGGPSRSAAPYSLTGPTGPSWTARPLVPPVALSGRPGLLLLHVEPDVAAELYRLETETTVMVVC